MVVTNSCCCFGLKTGGMIIGWYGLVRAIFGIVSYTQILPYIPEYMKMLNQSVSNRSDGREIKLTEYEIRSFCYTMVANEIVTVLMCAALLWGIYKSNRLLLIPWLLMNGLVIAALLILIFIISIFCFVAELVGPGFLVLLIGLLIMVLPLYFWLVVLSLYQRFKMEKRQNNRRGNNEEIGFNVSAPIMENKPPSYDILHKT